MVPVTTRPTPAPAPAPRAVLAARGTLGGQAASQPALMQSDPLGALSALSRLCDTLAEPLMSSVRVVARGLELGCRIMPRDLRVAPPAPLVG